jgi:deazaflavin-dependent oxidoreductase (nitroreductase family)
MTSASALLRLSALTLRFLHDFSTPQSPRTPRSLHAPWGGSRGSPTFSMGPGAERCVELGKASWSSPGMTGVEGAFPDVANWNERIIEEFRANGGRVGGPFKGHSLLLLHHRGAKSGIERVNPLACQSLGEGAWAVFGSKGGAPSNPDWFHNLVANPDASIEIGTEVVPVRARVAAGEERERSGLARSRSCRDSPPTRSERAGRSRWSSSNRGMEAGNQRLRHPERPRASGNAHLNLQRGRPPSPGMASPRTQGTSPSTLNLPWRYRPHALRMAF